MMKETTTAARAAESRSRQKEETKAESSNGRGRRKSKTSIWGSVVNALLGIVIFYALYAVKSQRLGRKMKRVENERKRTLSPSSTVEEKGVAYLETIKVGRCFEAPLIIRNVSSDVIVFDADAPCPQGPTFSFVHNAGVRLRISTCVMRESVSSYSLPRDRAEQISDTYSRSGQSNAHLQSDEVL